MKPLLGADGRTALAALGVGKPLLAFDFDGTLAPIVARPAEARVPLPVAGRLQRIAAIWPVAVITGRAVGDVAPRLGFRPHFIAGNHGIENPSDGSTANWDAALDPARSVLAKHRALLVGEGVTVEDKRYSIALHYRLAPSVARARMAIDAALEDLGAGFTSGHGKCVVNLVASGAPDKGDAVLSIARRCVADRGLFVGDDENDEAAFAKLGAHWVTVRVGACDARSCAEYCLGAPSELPAVLQLLLEAKRPGCR